jgi:lipopolysaccharide/colanic/teichoic acid biosynthesis glycosyltransferase
MGFFGPRPERPEIYERLNAEIPLFSMRTIVRPGITGWAQVCAGYAATVEESKRKLEYDLYYIKHMSPRLDLIILIKTIFGAFFGFKKEVPRLRLVAGQSSSAVKVGNA